MAHLPPDARRARHYLRFADLDGGEVGAVLARARELKAATRTGQAHRALAGRNVALLFERNSTRTRLSFEVGVDQLGGNAFFIDRNSTQLARAEPLADTARMFGSMCDALVARLARHADLEELAAHCAAPVINALTDQEHPCQVLADLLTFEEHRGPIAGRKVAWVGVCNNVCASWMAAAATCGFELAVAAPAGYDSLPGGGALPAGVSVGADPEAAVAGASCVVTDVWMSMGDDAAEQEERRAALAGYQVNARLMGLALDDAVFMHCLPAHRGEEVTAEVIDGERHSVVWDEAENRLHAQKALLEFLLAGEGK